MKDIKFPQKLGAIAIKQSVFFLTKAQTITLKVLKKMRTSNCLALINVLCLMRFAVVNKEIQCSEKSIVLDYIV